ncbi:MAG: 3-hydroxyacyl-CoA dehydrogenase family protein [Spirochaetales bacterium]|nr:3-hydroxyacyl-CoA dehydrogenase family protein [Spirochaetales bacterium]
MYEHWNVIIIGAGTMGSGIAQVIASKGIKTTLLDQKIEFCDRAKDLIKKNVDFLISEELADADYRSRTETNITYDVTDNLEKYAPKADMCIEAIFENAEAKKELFSRLDKLCRADCILASNTSASNIFEIAPVSNPDRQIITHWFNPPFVMDLVEVVMGPETSEEVLKEVNSFLIFLEKNPAVIRHYIPGFIVNRIANAILREASYMVKQGWTTPADIDTAIRETNGIRYSFEGPMALFDIVGWDLINTVSKDLFKSLSNNTDGSTLSAKLVKEGKLGLKTGGGIYDYGGRDANLYMNDRSKKIIKMAKSIKAM